MIKAMDVLKDLTRNYASTEDDVNEIEEYVIKAYLAIRMHPLIGIAEISENRINNIAEFFADLYFDYQYSLDILVNALYNYINTNKHCPSDKLLTDDIEILLEQYAK